VPGDRSADPAPRAVPGASPDVATTATVQVPGRHNLAPCSMVSFVYTLITSTMKKSTVLSIRLTPVVFEGLERAARRELRPTGQYVQKLIAEHLRQQQLITDDDVEAALLRALRSDRGRRRGRERPAKRPGRRRSRTRA
jgi:hypothetical protein